MKRYLRALRKNWRANLISLLGLSVAMMIAVLSVTYIVFENSYDRFHEKSDRTYQILTQLNFPNGQSISLSAVDDGLRGYLEERVPVVESVCRIDDTDSEVKAGEITLYKQSAIYADPEFMTLFDWEMLSGRREAIAEPGNALITPELASKLYGDENPMGQILEFQEKLFTVQGLVKEAPANSEFSYDLILPLYDKIGSGGKAGATNVEGYITTQMPLEDTGELKEKIDGYFKDAGMDTAESILVNIEDTHKYYTSSSRDILILICVSFLVLLVAGVNYFNIYTAQAELRLREMGVRKVSGASRQSIARMMVFEAIGMVFTALILGMILSELALPVFRDLTGKPLVLYGRGLSWIPIASVLLALITGFLTGLFPAYRYSRSRMTILLRAGERQGKARFTVRKALMVLQFSISTGLIISLLIFHSQLRFLANEDLGFETQDRVLIDVGGIDGFNYDITKARLDQIPGVVSSTGNMLDLGGGGMGSLLRLANQDAEEELRAKGHSVREGFIETYGIQMVQGRSFLENEGNDSATIIIDTYTADLLGLEDPIGAYVFFGNEDCRVIGVTEELRMFPMKNRRSAMYFTTKWNFNVNELTLHLAGDQKEVMATVERSFKELYPDFLFEYTTVEDTVGEFYNSDQNFFNIVLYAGLLALLLSLIGAYSMASYLAERKNKEICVRKVLGASVQSILQGSGLDLLRLIVIANLIAAPLAFYASRKWMENFVIKTNITPFPFIWALLLVLLFAWGTMYYKNRQAALSNPADVLRHE